MGALFLMMTLLPCALSVRVFDVFFVFFFYISKPATGLFVGRTPTPSDLRRETPVGKGVVSLLLLLLLLLFLDFGWVGGGRSFGGRNEFGFFLFFLLRLLL